MSIAPLSRSQDAILNVLDRKQSSDLSLVKSNDEQIARCGRGYSRHADCQAILCPRPGS